MPLTPDNTKKIAMLQDSYSHWLRAYRTAELARDSWAETRAERNMAKIVARLAALGHAPGYTAR